MGRVESQLERIENTLTQIKDKEVLDITAMAKEITFSVIESLRSATDVGQLVVSKVKKKKLRRPQNKGTTIEIYGIWNIPGIFQNYIFHGIFFF